MPAQAVVIDLVRPSKSIDTNLVIEVNEDETTSIGTEMKVVTAGGRPHRPSTSTVMFPGKRAPLQV